MSEYGHPYDYINEENFERIQTIFKVGLGSKKSPGEIADLLQKGTNLPGEICTALVQLELLPTMKKLKTMGLNKNMPKGSEFKHDV